jgi:malonyl CoA-acyl carrier protein transacylase
MSFFFDFGPKSMTSSLAAGQGPTIGAIEIYAKCFTVEEAVQSLKNTKRIG